MDTVSVDATTAARRTALDPDHQAFLALRTVFTVAPILFGIDKFTNWLTDWTIYLAPWINDLVSGDATQAMYAVGAVEILLFVAAVALARLSLKHA